MVITPCFLAHVAAPVSRWTMHRRSSGSEKGRFFELLVTYFATYRRLDVAGVRRCGSPLVQRSNILFYTTQSRSQGGRRVFVRQVFIMVVYDHACDALKSSILALSTGAREPRPEKTTKTERTIIVQSSTGGFRTKRALCLSRGRHGSVRVSHGYTWLCETILRP